MEKLYRMGSSPHIRTKENVENLGVKLYKNFYKNEEIKNGNTFRLFKNRTGIGWNNYS